MQIYWCYLENKNHSVCQEKKIPSFLWKTGGKDTVVWHTSVEQVTSDWINREA